MSASRILIVEDNPITRKMVRVTLESAGHVVLEAPDARTALEIMTSGTPDLILQDLILPDMDGFELVKRLRALPGASEIPILAFSGFLAKIEEALTLQMDFTDCLFKPVDPTRLLQAIQAYLPRARELTEPQGIGKRVIVVDDDPLQLRLMKIHLEQSGFVVITAENGWGALEQARRSPPDAIVSDVLMPDPDGFRLCLAIRQELQLSHIPVILTSSYFVEEADRVLGRNVGADAFVTRTPEATDVIDALRSSLLRTSSRPSVITSDVPTDEYAFRVIRQLERQVGLNANLARRLSRLEAEFGILTGLAETLTVTASVETVLHEVLYRCSDAAGVSQGVILLFAPGGRFALGAQFGYSDSERGRLEEFFGHGELLRRAAKEAEPTYLPSAVVGGNEGQELLARAGSKSMLIVPLILGREHLGVLVMASANRELGMNWIPFAKALAGQIAQAVGLARSLSLLSAAEAKYRALVEQSLVGVCITTDSRFVYVNQALADMCGYRVEELVERLGLMEVTHPDDRPLVASHIRERLSGEVEWARYVFRALHRNGATIQCEVFARGILYEGKPAILSTVLDVTERRRAEEHRQAMYRLAVLLGRSLQLDEIFPAFAEAVKAVLPYDRIGVVVPDSEGLRTALSVAEPPLRSHQGKTWPQADRTATSWVLRYRIPRVVQELTAEQAFPDEAFMYKEGVRSTLTMPLLIGGNALGVFVLESCQPAAYNERSLELVEPVAHQLAFALENAHLYDALRQEASLLETKVEERTRELQEAKRFVEEASRHKSEFLASISHELRTPLNAIIGFSELLKAQTSGSLNEKQIHFAEYIRESGQHLLALINDLLDLSKIEAGKIELRPQTFLLRDALKAALSAIRPQAEVVGIGLGLRADDAPATVVADPVRFKQILLNLLSNSVKFTPKGGKVTLAARQVRAPRVVPEKRQPAGDDRLTTDPASEFDWLEIVVQDTGVGIKPEDLSKLFQLFRQLDAGLARRDEGTGLGLALTKRLVELHGGAIWASSEGEGCGSTFTIRLPMDPAGGPGETT